MMWNRFLAASMVLLMTGPAWAYDMQSGNGGRLQLSASPNATSIYSADTDSVPLRGHLTAVPKGTMMMIRMDQPVSSSASKPGDTISAVIEADVYSDNQVVIPAGAQVEGSVMAVSPAAHVGKSGEIEVQFHQVKLPNGQVYPMRAHVVTADQTGVIKGDSDQARVFKTVGSAAAVTGAGTLMGTAAGSLIGSAGGGALFGLGVGALAGMGYAVIREGKHVTIPSGARLSIVLDQPIKAN